MRILLAVTIIFITLAIRLVETDLTATLICTGTAILTFWAALIIDKIKIK